MLKYVCTQDISYSIFGVRFLVSEVAEILPNFFFSFFDSLKKRHLKSLYVYSFREISSLLLNCRI